ncbi:MAG: SMP-30/gluconolactonase/LRE family protein [Xanthomonadales bacterium]|nr:SMP-30/gluconolactonase/LRE family protein [Xanthomonadales bacterium]
MADTDYESLDKSFGYLVSAAANVEKIWSGGIWTEGPAYFPAHKSLVWSDIPNNRMMRYDETNGEVGVFRHQSNFANGNAIDRQGRLISCEQGSRRITRTEYNGDVSVLVDNYKGKKFNSPNDVVIKSDDTIWFTDPAYGIETDFEGFRAESEIGSDNVYRLDPNTGECQVVADDFKRPNGLAFSADETKLYIADSGGWRFPENPHHIRTFDVSPENTLSGGEVFAECTNGVFDGFRLDALGHIWTSAQDGVHCYHPSGQLLGKILVPEGVSNLTFGGERNNRLYITATSSIYTVMLRVKGQALF